MKKGSYYILLFDVNKQKYTIKENQGYIFEVNDLTFGICLIGKKWAATTLYNGTYVYFDDKLCDLKKKLIEDYLVIKTIVDVDKEQAEYKQTYEKLIREKIYNDGFKA